jgi:hypothetical protein
MGMSENADVAFAIAGLGGNNAMSAGFLAAAQEATRCKGVMGALYPGLAMISCTSGAIPSTARYLQGGDLRALVQEAVDAVDRATWLPRESWADPARSSLVTGWTGLPGIFGSYSQALLHHLVDQSVAVMAGDRPPIPPTPTEWFNIVAPAGLFLPRRPDRDFAEWARTFNEEHHGVGIAFNSFDPAEGVEYLYVNQPGMELIQRHHDHKADYDGFRKGTYYKPITPEGLKRALWLFWYGFDQSHQHVDGCYARSIILNELTFANKIFAVKPINHRWLGPLPKNMLEALDMQTELWMGTSYRLQKYQIDLINERLKEHRLLSEQDMRKWLGTQAPGQAVAPGAGGHLKDYHQVDVVPVEMTVQRGFFNYFIEDMNVFEAAFQQGLEALG